VNPLQIIQILVVVVSMAAGQILFKLAAGRIDRFSATDWKSYAGLLGNGYLVVGVFVYALTAILWVLVLRSAPLSRAYPFMALSFLLVPAAGPIIFKEPFSWSLPVGGTLILMGIVVIARA
jgi:multidrug transporter EmrE-like cation transporter